MTLLLTLAVLFLGWKLTQYHTRIKALELVAHPTPQPPQKPASEIVREAMDDHIRTYHK